MGIDIAALRRMAAAGATADVIITFLETQENGRKAKRDRDRERQRAIRGDIARHRATSRDIADTTQQADRRDALAPTHSVPEPRPPDQQIPVGASLSSLTSLSSKELSASKKDEVSGDARGKNARNMRFDEFWKAYPHRVGKQAARKAHERIIRLGIATPEEIMAGLARYAAKTDDRPWCNPATFLNQHRWEDEPALFTVGAPRPGSKEHMREESYRALQQLKAFAAGADEGSAGGLFAGQDARVVSIAEFTRSKNLHGEPDGAAGGLSVVGRREGDRSGTALDGVPADGKIATGGA